MIQKGSPPTGPPDPVRWSRNWINALVPDSAKIRLFSNDNISINRNENRPTTGVSGAVMLAPVECRQTKRSEVQAERKRGQHNRLPTSKDRWAKQSGIEPDVRSVEFPNEPLGSNSPILLQ